MEKRVLLAIFLSFLVLVAYQSLVPPPPDPLSPAPAKSASGTQAPAATPGATPTGRPAPTSPQAFAQPLVAGLAETDVVVETSTVTATFNTREAVLKSWRLKRYSDGSGQPLELVPQDLPPDVARPFALAFSDQQDTALVARAIFRASAPSLDVTSDSQSLSFEYRDANGLAVTKSFSFDAAHPYVVSFTVRAERAGKPLDPQVQLGAMGPAGHSGSSTSYVAPARAIIAEDGDPERIGVKDLAKPEKAVHTGVFRFAGADEHYFISALVRPDEQIRVEYRAITGPPAGDKPGRSLVAYSARFSTAPSNKRLFLGPKDFTLLQAVDPLFVRAIDFGMFRIIVVPLLNALKRINAWAGNYGLSIIILTVLINAAMFPLRHKSVVSMRKMQEIQPEVKAIQDRYAKLKMSDPARQKMNVELMNLYREKGANPASGCIPMLLTFPVLIAFYSLLSVAIELRGAPFAGWIRDLSQPDPLYITPILMGATMVWQQKLTPMTTADPVQQKMMMFMPVMFTVFFLWAPSGLVLYWFVSNLWAIGQQLVTNRIIGPPRVHAVRPAAERRVKRVGGSKTDQAESGGRAT
jgi:YidC/Oxa1 family membrane protein insertase